MKAKESFNAIRLMAETNAREGRLVLKTLEELGELADALKPKDGLASADRFKTDREARHALVGEIADVKIMLNQLAMHYELGGELSAMADYKIYRTLHEMADEARQKLEEHSDAADEA